MADGDRAAVDVDVRTDPSPSSLLTARACAAKASLASIESRSPTFQPAFSSALREAGIGPVPMMDGSTPAVAQEAMRASGVRPRLAASAALISTSAAAAVIDARGVAGGDRAVLGEGRAQLGQRLIGRAMRMIFVLVDDDVALLGRDREGNDLVLELAGLLRGLGLVLGGDGELVLLFAGDLPFGGDILRRRCPCDSR